jgi:circadian clock protein KaiC
MEVSSVPRSSATTPAWFSVDGLNDYLNAIPQVEAPLVRMHELLSFLNERGVATLVVVAQRGIVGARMATPLDVSYLADAVVLPRFFESHGMVRRALSVMKKRVGKALSECHEVVTGVPLYLGGAAPSIA